MNTYHTLRTCFVFVCLAAFLSDSLFAKGLLCAASVVKANCIKDRVVYEGR